MSPGASMGDAESVGDAAPMGDAGADPPPVTVAFDVSAIHPTSGGVRTYASELLRRLPGAGITPALIRRRGDAPATWPPQRVLAWAPARRPPRLAWEQVALPRHLRTAQPRPSVLHSPHYTMPERGVPAGIARVVTVHDLTFFTHPDRHQRAKLALFRRAIRVAAAKASAIVCVSDFTARQLRTLVSVRAPVHVIPHGVDHSRFRPDAAPDDDDAVRDGFGLQRPYLLHVGALEPRKNIPALIDAHHGLVRAGLDLELVLVGTAPRGVQAPLPAGCPGRVRRLGFVPDEALPALLRGAAVVVYPSVEEGFGLPVLEALAVGAPVVTTAGTVMEEVAGDTAHLVPSGDVNALAEGIERALVRDDLRRSRGLARAAEYTWERSAAAHAAVYRSVARLETARARREPPGTV